MFTTEVRQNPYYKQEKFTDTVNVFPFLCSKIEIWRFQLYKEKQKRF